MRRRGGGGEGGGGREEEGRRGRRKGGGGEEGGGGREEEGRRKGGGREENGRRARVYCRLTNNNSSVLSVLNQDTSKTNKTIKERRVCTMGCIGVRSHRLALKVSVF